MPIAVHIDNADPLDTSLVHVEPERYDELHNNLENIIVKPYITQGEDTKICVWVLEDYEEKSEFSEENLTDSEVENIDINNTGEGDRVAQAVIACAAEAYETDAGQITFETDIRQDLSNASIKMIVMLSGIEDALGVTIEIMEAGSLNTIGDFVKAVKEKIET